MHDFALSRSSLNGAIESKQSTATGVLYVPIQFMATERLYKISPGEDLRIGSSPEMELVGDPNTLPPHVATIRMQDAKLVIVNEAKQNRITIEHARHQDVVVADTPVELTGRDEIHIEGLFLNMTLGTLYRTDLASPVFRQHVLDVINHPSLYRSEGGLVYAVKTDSLQYAHVIKNSEPATAITDLPHFDDNELANSSDSRFQWYRPEGGMLTHEADARLYLPLNPTVSSQDRNQLVTKLWELVRQNPKSVYFKVRQTLRSRDAIVVFFNHAAEKDVADRVIAITQSFDPAIYASGPAFTQRLAPGVYFGQNPNAVQEFDVLGQQKDVSFSTLRGEAMAQAWEIIVRSETPGHPLDVDEKMAIIAHVFKKRDIDTDNPAFNASGPTTFPHIQELIQSPAVNGVTVNDWISALNATQALLDQVKSEYAKRIDAGEAPESLKVWRDEVVVKQLEASAAAFYRIYKLAVQYFDEQTIVLLGNRQHNLVRVMHGLMGFSPLKRLTNIRALCDANFNTWQSIEYYLVNHYDAQGNVSFHYGSAEVLDPAWVQGGIVDVLSNLISNAVEHPRDGQHFTKVDVLIGDDHIVVKDDGMGVSPDSLAAIRSGQRIHDGQRLDPMDTSTIHGRGWDDIRETCRALGIKWGIESVLGEGTTVTLNLPDQFLRNPFLPESSSKSRAAIIAIRQAVKDVDMETLMLAIKEYIEVTRAEVRQILDSGEDYAAVYERVFRPEYDQFMLITGGLVLPENARIRDIHHDLIHEYGRLSVAMDLAALFSESLPKLRLLVSPPTRSVDGLLKRLEAPMQGIIRSGVKENRMIADSVDLDSFERILANLVGNAEGHPRLGERTVVINVKLVGNRLVVQDKGAGMDAATLNHIRQGTRVHDGKVVTSGDHGHGWHSIRDLCNKLGITWEIDSQPGVGTVVTLTLPDGFLKTVD